MRTKKPNTLQQKLGFLDEDLKSPKHDDIMLWLDKNILSILTGLFYKPLTEDNYKGLFDNAKQNITKTIIDRNEHLKLLTDGFESYQKSKYQSDKEKEALTSEIERENKKVKYLEEWKGFDSKPLRPDIIINSKVWELPVTTQSRNYNSIGSKYTVGFIDMGVNFSSFIAYVHGFTNEYNGYERVSDIKEKIRIDFKSEQTWIYLEVKTEIKSLGELIRQIRHYKEYLPGAYYVVSPEDKHKTTLEEQQIGFIKYSE